MATPSRSESGKRKHEENNDGPEFSGPVKKMMRLQGYRGGALGKQSDGITEPIDAGPVKLSRHGFGFARNLDKIKIDYKEEEIVIDEVIEYIEADIEEHDLHFSNWMKTGRKKLVIEDETNFCNEEILTEILKWKNCLDEMDGNEIHRARIRSNPYEKIKKGIFMNRAAMKMANIDSILDFELTKYNREDKKELLYFADVCAGPGGFSEYVLWRRKWRAKGFGFTLVGDCDFKLHDFKAASTESFEPYYGPKGDGDVYNPANVQGFVDLVHNQTDDIGVHFMMADGGFSVAGQENLQEILSRQLYLSQCLIALSVVRPGGHFICKLFDIFTPFSVGLIYLMRMCFEKIAVHKPVTSRPANSERYIICRNLKNNSNIVEQVKHYLTKCHEQMWEWTQNKNDKMDILQLVPLEILTNSKSNFYKYIRRSNEENGERQIQGLKNILAFHKNHTLVEKRQNETRKLCLAKWVIPESPDLKNNPGECEDLLQYLLRQKSHGQNTNFLKQEQEVLLTEKNINQINKLEWMFLPIETSVFKRSRGFYLSFGGSKVYRYENYQWRKVSDVTINMAPHTLVFGEIVYGTKSKACFHIIDAFTLGDEKVFHLSYEDRLQECNLFGRAMSKCRTVPIFAKCAIPLTQFHGEFIKKLQRNNRGQPIFPIDCKAKPNELFTIAGLCFLRVVKDPWVIAFSKSRQEKYYFNTKVSNSATFEIPHAAISDFITTMENRIIWWWKEKVEPQNSELSIDLLHRML